MLQLTLFVNKVFLRQAPLELENEEEKISCLYFQARVSKVSPVSVPVELEIQLKGTTSPGLCSFLLKLH